jgi:hypothetical protein
MLCSVASHELTEVPMVLAASIIRETSALMMGAVRTSETSVNFYETQRPIFILVAERT